MNRKRRSLVLVDESARHPFRMSLPPHVRKPIAQAVPATRMRTRFDLADWRGFLAAYCATFAAVFLYFA